MPKYVYKCIDCSQHFEVVHGILEDHTACGFCPSTKLMRVPQMPHLARQETQKGGKVGDEVKRAIEENRAILKEERKKRVELPDGD